MSSKNYVNEKKNKHIGIVGAGASGLMAAKTLKKYGYNVSVYEARSRLGGRIYTDYSIADYPIELGAEFIHGSNAYTWELLDQDTKSDVHLALSDDSAFGVYKAGKMLYHPQTDRLKGFKDLKRLESIWFKPLKDKTVLSLLKGPVDEWFNHMIASDYGADLKHLGVKGFVEASYDGQGEGDFRLNKGYFRFIEQLAEGLDIYYQHVVSHIDYSKEDVELFFSDQDKKQFDAVIVTLPLGVLKSGEVTFKPNLNHTLKKAINHIGVGYVNKIVMEFEAPFWKDNLEWFATEKPTQIWWRPGYHQNNEIPVLTALIGGEQGKRFSSMSEKEAIKEGLHDLSQMFPNKPVNKLFKKGFFINWGNDPFSKMGYSYNGVGSASMRKKFGSVIDKKLVFAGEATHPIFPATVHGALLSSLRAVNKLKKFIE